MFVLFMNAKRIENKNDHSKLKSFEESLIRRYLLDKYFQLNQRDVLTFTDDQQKFQDDALNTHNILRATHCVPPLILDDEINTRAQIYAEILANDDKGLIHSTDRRGIFGENLYAVTRTNPITNPDAEKVTRTWYSEVVSYNYSTPGYKPHIAHFSQIVWKNTKEFGIGFAFARERRKMYVVAQYRPPGNYDFAYSENVLEAQC